MVQIIPPKPEYNRFEIPESFGKNLVFEKFILQNLFPQQYYSMIDSASDYLSKVDNFHRPDFILRDSSSGFEFYIRCKYHHALISNSFRFNKSLQADQSVYFTEKPIFLVLGLGGSPDSPNEIYFSDFNDCPNEHLLKRHLKGKFITTNQVIRISDMWNQKAQEVIFTKKIA